MEEKILERWLQCIKIRNRTICWVGHYCLGKNSGEMIGFKLDGKWNLEDEKN